ncbi:hypothetical protein NBRC116492_10200 [Aurantivibrio infirmus]
MDYSELTSTGEHVFLVTRTHGTSGPVSAQFSSHGDAHDTVSGTLNWADGDASILSIRVNVPSKTPGDHRIYLQLSNPTGGAALHFSNHTRAYGVIDDGTIAPDNEAVFFDTNLGSNGNGSQNSPYNNIYDAIANVGAKRYIYGRGTVVPDSTNQGSPYGQNVNCISVPASRNSEANRCIIRNWPGSTLTVNGNGGNYVSGFLSTSNESYHTYRGITFINMVTASGAGTPAWGIWYHYGTTAEINVELCDFDNINGGVGENHGGVNLYGITAGRVWRCKFSNIQTNGDNKNGNTGGVYSYLGNYLSVQRCEFAPTMAKGIFHKRTQTGDISLCSRFNIFRGCHLTYAISGGGNPGHAGILVTNNLFIGSGAALVHHSDQVVSQQNQNQISNNYFYQCGVFDQGAIQNFGGADFKIFNNIFDNCRWVYSDEQGFGGDTPSYFDHNIAFNTQSNFALDNYNLFSATAYAASFNANFNQNASAGNPRPTNTATEDFTLQNSSAAVAAGTGGVDAGIYLTGLEKIGANTVAIINPGSGPAPGPSPAMCTPPPSPVNGQKIIFS